ncbi:DUF4439 domain-containing protein [Cellulomonas soli]|uniref:DUF4439 domain-containing protein n=1 Tax=Cellulomonas soli TaxID=931535 RepID=UPI003F876647
MTAAPAGPDRTPRSPALPRPGRARSLRAIAAAFALIPVLAACGIRLETPAPTEPAPDTLEQVRARTVEDAQTLALTAAAAREAVAEGTEPGVDPAALTLVLDDVAAHSTQHAQQLGGEYDSGLPDPSPSPTGTPAPTTATSTEVLALLADAATTALDDARTVEDGPLARLIASVGTSRTGLAQRLAAATGQAVPEGTSTGGTGTPATTEPGPETDAPSGAPSSTTQAEATAPSGLASEDLDALVLAEDQAGYGFEVLAAVLGDGQRDRARADAADHRARAEQWAVLAGTSGTAADPRRVAYAVPPALTDPAVAAELARTLQTTLASTYATLVARADAGSRDTLVEGLLRATADAATWGAPVVAFPGMPELTTTAG